MDIDVRFIDNSDEILAEMKKQIAVALEKCGLLGEGYAKKLCPVNNGRLRASISHKRDDEAAYIGTNVEYAAYVELGTGQYYPGGRQSPWSYQDEKGDWHRTKGQKPQPYLKPAVADHAGEYEQIIKDALKTE